MGSLFVAWRPRQPDPIGWRPVGRLDYDAGIYKFAYLQGAQKAGFRPFAKMDDLRQIYESDELFPLFQNRLLSKSRPEYEAFLRWSGFEIDHPPDPILILSVSEGLRETDAIEVFPCPVPDGEGCFLSKFFLHGIRWLPDSAIGRVADLKPNEPLKLMLDRQNEHDPQAVAVRTDAERTLIGYVPRYLAGDVGRLIDGCDFDAIKLVVDRVNADAPLQNRVLCRMRACWPDDFQPCNGADFSPLASNLSAECVG